jgi:uncharacterized membrane protein HdeD (DUF308 family)
MRSVLAGLALIVFGVLYLRWPAIYRRGLWLKTSIAIRFLSESNYKRYMKGLGIVFVVAGVCLSIYGLVQLAHL